MIIYKMRLQRILILTLFLLSVLHSTTQCLGPGGVGSADTGAASCSPLNGVDSSENFNYEDSAYNLETMSIPVTIAKNSDEGVDAISPYFQEAAGIAHLKKPILTKNARGIIKVNHKLLATPTSNILGTFFFYSVGNKCDKALVFAPDGTTLDILTPDPDLNCRYSYRVTEENPLFAVVTTKAEEIVDNIPVSRPVYFKLNPPIYGIDHYFFNIYITGVDTNFGNTDISEFVEVQNKTLGFLNLVDEETGEEESHVIIPVLNEFNKPQLWSMKAKGGEAIPFIDLDVLSEDMYSDPDAIHFLDIDKNFHKVTSDGIDTEIGLVTNLNHPKFKPYISGDYFIYDTIMENPYTGRDTAVPVIYIVATDEHMPLFLKRQPMDFISIDFDWIDSSRIILFAQVRGGRFAMFSLTGVDKFIAGSIEEVPFSLLHEEDLLMDHPKVAQGGDIIYYNCKNPDSGFNNICEYNLTSDQNRTVVDNDWNIEPNFQLSYDKYSYLTFQVPIIKADGQEIPIIGFYNRNTEEIVLTNAGNDPVPSNADQNIVAYKHRMEDSPHSPIQVGILNLDHTFVRPPEELQLFPANKMLGRDQQFSLQATGGSLPYTFRIISGVGEIIESIGYYTAPHSAGTAVIRVTDNAGNTADGALHIADAAEFDTNFAINGDLNLSSINGRGNALSFGKQGNILIASTTTTGKFALTSLNTNGSDNISFGTHTKHTVTTSVGSAENAEISDVIIDPVSGTTYVAGTAEELGTDDFALVSYNHTGRINIDFGDQGIVLTDFADSEDTANRIAKQRNGKIIVSGFSVHAAGQDFAIARFDKDGSLDTTFGGEGTGKRLINLDAAPRIDKAQALLVLPDDKIIMAGYTVIGGKRRASLIKLLANGETDNSFGTNGVAITALGPNDTEITDIVIDNNKLTTAGIYRDTASGKSKVMLVRYDLSGNLDQNFGNNGIVLHAPAPAYSAFAYSLVIDSFHHIIVGGMMGNGFNPNLRLLVRYRNNGSVDKTFGSRGVAQFPDEGDVLQDSIQDLLLLPDDRIMYTGYVYDETEKHMVPNTGRVWY